jgi:hypothetical protein
MPDLGDPFPVVKFTYTGDDRNAEAYEGKLSKIDMDDDFALIDFTTIDDLMVAPIATQEIIDSLKFAEPIYNASFPYSLEQVYGEGWLGHLVTPTVGPTGEQMFEMKSLRMVNIDVAPGSSGSAIFVKRDGQYYVISTLTGIIQVAEGDSGYIGFLPVSEKLLEFLQLPIR